MNFQEIELFNFYIFYIILYFNLQKEEEVTRKSLKSVKVIIILKEHYVKS